MKRARSGIFIPDYVEEPEAPLPPSDRPFPPVLRIPPDAKPPRCDISGDDRHIDVPAGGWGKCPQLPKTKA